MERLAHLETVLLIVFLIALAFLGRSEKLLAQSNPGQKVNAPYFSGNISYAEAAVFWFGRVTPSENHVDVRVGYNESKLLVNVAIFDRRLWYDQIPSATDLTNWDAVSLYLNLRGNTGERPQEDTYRFDGQLNWWESRENYQAAYQGDGLGWLVSDASFSAVSGWRGNAPNDDQDDRGWVLTYHLPFSSFGLSGPPPSGTVWGMAMTVYDRDGTEGMVTPSKSWPEVFEPNRPTTWNQFSFGLPVFQFPPAVSTQSAIIRDKLNGAVVPDAMVGGGTVCGDGLDFWTQWGEANYSGYTYVNVQNQTDVADWPCFSRYYLAFPLSSLPFGKEIVSARLTLHQFGNSDPSQAQPSLIQIFRVGEDWDEGTINWNNSPLALENVSQSWIDPLTESVPWPGAPRHWDVSAAVSRAYQLNEPLRLALYSADSAYHSGKYFVSSDTGDWNEVGRPTLEVVYGDPASPETFPDVNRDGVVNGWDFVSTSHSFGTALNEPGFNLEVDFNSDGRVDHLDVNLLLTNWRRETL